MTNLNKARLDPTSVFHAPEDILARDDLSRAQKIDLLRRWEYDARELEVAEDEGMVSTQPDLLERVLQGLHDLEVWHDADQGAPTKQGGSSR